MPPDYPLQENLPDAATISHWDAAHGAVFFSPLGSHPGPSVAIVTPGFNHAAFPLHPLSTVELLAPEPLPAEPWAPEPPPDADVALVDRNVRREPPPPDLQPLPAPAPTSRPNKAPQFPGLGRA